MEGRQHLAVLLQLIAWAQAAAPGPAVGCPDRAEALGAAREAVELVDRELADALLGQVIVSFGCGEVAAPDAIAEYFLLEGAMASYRRDDAGVHAAFQAASAVSPTFWLTTLGPGLQARFVEARERAPGSGELRFAPPIAPRELFVDGGRAAESDPMAEGMHLVQVTELDRVVLARVVVIPAGGTHMVEHALPPWSPPVAAPEAELAPAAPAAEGLALHAGLGFGLGAGRPLAATFADGRRHEPGPRVAAAFELGLTTSRRGLFGRVAVGVAPMLAGQLLYQVAEGPRSSRASFSGHLALGLTRDRFDLGGLTGPSWPGRWQVRALGAVRAFGPVLAELRVGLNAATARPAEPAGELLVVIRPGV